VVEIVSQFAAVEASERRNELLNRCSNFKMAARSFEEVIAGSPGGLRAPFDRLVVAQAQAPGVSRYSQVPTTKGATAFGMAPSPS